MKLVEKNTIKQYSPLQMPIILISTWWIIIKANTKKELKVLIGNIWLEIPNCVKYALNCVCDRRKLQAYYLLQYRFLQSLALWQFAVLIY